MASQENRRTNESTPLLSNSLPAHFRFHQDHEVQDCGEDDDDDNYGVDIGELSLSLARVGSIASASGLLEPGGPLFDGTLSRRVSMAKRSGSEPAVTEILNGYSFPEDEAEDPRFINITPKRFWAIFTCIMLAYFVACFDTFLMASSHPVITSYFHASQAAPWLSTVFLITSTAFQPLFGRLSDMVGRRPMFALSTFLFALTTLWCATATSIESFIGARAACGLAAGGTMVLSLIITSDLIRIEHRGVFQSHGR